MSFKGLILQEKAGQRIDKDFLASAAQIYSTGYGVSVVIDKNLTTNGVIPEGGNSVEDLTDLIKDFEEDDVVLFLFDSDDEPKEDDLQPYVLFREENEDPDKQLALLCCFITGELKKHVNDSGYSPQHQFAFNFLQPAIDELLQNSSATDEDELVEEINTNQTFQNKLLEEGGDDLKIVFHSRGGMGATVAKDGTGDLNFDWGWSSGPVEAPKKKTLGGKSKIGADSTLVPAAKKAAAAEPPRQVRVEIPPDMSNNDRRNFIHGALGQLPKDTWKDMKFMMVDYKKAKELGLLSVKNFQEMGKKLGEYPEGAAKAATDKQASQPPIPLVTAEDKKKTDQFINVLDPSTWKSEELKVSDWSSQTGHFLFPVKDDNGKAVSLWPFSELKRYVTEVPEAAACLLFELVKRLSAAQAVVDKAKPAAAAPKKSLGGKKNAA